ncbi:putative binding protein component of ABC transporter [Pseudomonas aeruginosa]|nr:putative binding protein component of ABC transporter [Pseudomonas aeruginosa]
MKFHSTDYFKPTREFNADDVLFTFERMLDKDHPFRKAYPTEFPYFTDMGLDKNIARIEKLDEHTVKFTLNEVDAAFIQNLAMPFPSIQSAEYAAQLLKQGKASDINQKPIGTGPFVFSRYQKDAQIRFKGNKDYWKPDEVKVDNLIFAINTDASVRAQKLKAGECQITLNPRPADLDALKKDPNLNLPSQAGFNLGYIAYNVTHKPFDKLEVRQALDMAVNKKAIIDAVYQGAGQLASNGMPPTQWSYDETIKDAPYDPGKARELLKKAGVAEGTEITLWAMPVQRPYNPNAKLMAEMLQNDWAKIGIKAKIVTYEWGEYIKRAKGGEHDAMLIGWSGDNATRTTGSAPSTAATRWTATTSPNGATPATTSWSRIPSAPPTRASAPSCTSRPSTSSRNRCRSPRSPTPPCTSRCARRYTTSGSAPSA